MARAFPTRGIRGEQERGWDLPSGISREPGFFRVRFPPFRSLTLGGYPFRLKTGPFAPSRAFTPRRTCDPLPNSGVDSRFSSHFEGRGRCSDLCICWCSSIGRAPVL